MAFASVVSQCPGRNSCYERLCNTTDGMTGTLVPGRDKVTASRRNSVAYSVRPSDCSPFSGRSIESFPRFAT